jgi:tRNA (cmo5U34)-methyltransferase
MPTPLQQKSTPAEIEQRFDQDVERFANLETGQVATMDAPRAMELITAAALAATPVITRMLDIGCGAGNNTVKLLRSHGGSIDCDLNDLSMPMLLRARQRVARETSGRVAIVHGDFRTARFADDGYDIVLAAAVLHHLRDEKDWLDTFAKIHRLLRPQGSFWVTDLVSHENDRVHQLMWRRYGAYLEATAGKDWQEQVFRCIDREDSPRPVTFQLDLMRQVGFHSVDLLHKNSCFAAFGGIKG